MGEPVGVQVRVAGQLEGAAPVVEAAVQEQQQVGGRSADRGIGRAGLGQQGEAVGAQADQPVAVAVRAGTSAASAATAAPCWAGVRL
ncbi:hypothetical protein [Streptomyces sp. NPDC054838]